MNLKDFFEFERLAFALNGQSHTHKKEEDPYEKNGRYLRKPRRYFHGTK
jgi:hypothetical protein